MALRRAVHRGFRLGLGFVVIVCMGRAGRGETPSAKPAGDAALTDYLTANGMLGRGLYELAVPEYRKFLEAHGDHDKARVARYGLAVSLFRLNRHEEALAELDRLADLREFEYGMEVGVMIGQCRLALKQHRQAAEVFKKLGAVAGEHELADDAIAGLLESLYLDGRHDEVIAIIQSDAAKLERSPLRGRAEFFAGLSLLAKPDFHAAAERFTTVIKLDGDGPLAKEAQPLLAQCRGQGEFTRAQGLFEEKQFEAAQASFEKVAKSGDDLADDAAYWAAKCLLRRGDFAGAAKRLDRIQADHPESELLPEIAYDRAIASLKGGADERAAEALNGFVSSFPDHSLAPEAAYLLCTLDQRAKRYDEGRARCTRFLEEHPGHERAAAVAFLMAETEFLAGRLEAAVAAYQRFLKSHETDAQAASARFRIGMALHSLGRPADARPWLEKSVRGKETPEAFRAALLALGDVLFEAAEWKDAEERLAEYLSLGDDPPGAADALLKLGLARQRQGRPAEAIESYHRLIDRFPKSAQCTQAIFERGQAYLAVQKPEEAAKDFERVIGSGADDRFAPHALNHLAAIALARKDPTKAAEYLDQVGRTKPGEEVEADALLRRGEALMAAAEFRAAEECFGRLLERRPADRIASAAAAHRAVALSRLGRREDALTAIEALEKVAPAISDPALRQSVLYEKAWCLRELKRADAARAAYRELLAAQGPAAGLIAHAALELAELEFAAGQIEQASVLLRRLVDAPSEAALAANVREQALYRLGVCEYESQRFAESAELLESLLNDFPKSPLSASALLFAGEALLKIGKSEQAAAHLTRVVEEFADDPACGPAMLRLGDGLANQQKWARSEQVFSRYLERFADHEYAHQAAFGVGWARENQSRWDEAIDAYRKVTARHQGPTAARAQFQIGECHFAQKRYEDAVRELLKVDILYAYPEWSAAALFEAGRCFEKLAKTAEAHEQFRAVKERFPESPWAKKAADQLAAAPKPELPGR